MTFDTWNETMNKAGNKLNRLMPLITPTGVLLGIILGKNVSWMKPSVIYLFGFLTFSGTLSISSEDFFNTLKKPRFILCYIASSFIFMPILTYVASNIFFKTGQDIGSGFIAVRAISTAVVTTIWASIYSGNLAVSVSIVVLDTLAAPIITPAIIRILANTSAPIDALGMFKSLMIMVVIPSVLGMTCNTLKGGKIRKVIQPTLKPFSKILLGLVIMINCSTISEKLISEFSAKYLFIALFSIMICISGYGTGYYFSKLFKLSKPDQVSVTFAVAMRNTSAALVIAIGFMPPDSALPAIFCIMFQQMIGSVFGAFLFKDKNDCEAEVEKR